MALTRQPVRGLDQTVLQTAVVVRSDASGVWARPLGGDTRHPIGPCRGGWSATGTRVAAGAVVLLALTQERPWVLATDEPL